MALEIEKSIKDIQELKSALYGLEHEKRVIEEWWMVQMEKLDPANAKRYADTCEKLHELQRVMDKLRIALQRPAE